jgi:hypothetical protein
MSDPKPETLSSVELATAFVELAKRHGQEDVFVLVCGPVGSNGAFERCALVDGDAVKVTSGLAAFIREKLPPRFQQRLLEIIAQPPTQEPTDTPWVN